VHFKGEYLLWFGIGLAMSFVLARYLGLEIDWHLVTGAPPGVRSAARKYAYGRTALFMVLREHLRAIFRVMMCARSITRARADWFTPTLISTGLQWR
jgi:hypothetical protein